MRVNKMNKICFLFILFIPGLVFSYAPTNFYRPYDVNLRMSDWEDTSFRIGVNAEYGTVSKSRDSSDHRVGLLSIYNESESGLAMLMGAAQGSDIYNLANQFLPPYGAATDDDVRGHFKVSGKYEELDLTVEAKYKLPIKAIPGEWDVFLYVPFRHMEIKNVNWVDQTKNVLSSDKDVHRYLTDDFENTVASLGDLDLKSWSKTGLSDLVLMLRWCKDFKQMKEHLKTVKLSVRLGLAAPTGAQKDEDRNFSLPLGNDGAWGIPASIGLDLFFIHHFKLGGEFGITLLFDETRMRRLKTDVNQTDFLLLHKGKATKSYGATFNFNLFAEAERFWGGLSAKVAFQFLKHDNDKLTAQTNDFDYNIINTAQHLKDWSAQEFIFQLNYDFFKECKKRWLKPQLSIFYKIPVNGKRVINTQTFGGQLAVNF